MFFKIITKLKNCNAKLYSLIKKQEFGNVGANCMLSQPLYLNCGNLISIGNNFHTQKRTRLEAFNAPKYNSGRFKIIIGNNVHINWNCHIGAINRVEIQDNVLIGSNVLIIDHQHGEINNEAIAHDPEKRELWSKGPVVIGKSVWIGEGVAIMPGISIGENSIIGANSVVTKDIPANCVAAGNPAKIIKYL